MLVRLQYNSKAVLHRKARMQSRKHNPNDA
jgi:hypothetical protein